MPHDIPDNQITKGFTEKPKNTEMTQVISRNCFHEDGAIKVAEYIVNEIKQNTKSFQGENIRNILRIVPDKSQNLLFDIVSPEYPSSFKDAFFSVVDKVEAMIQPNKVVIYNAFLLAMGFWVERVNTGRPWDHKPIIREKFRADAVHRLSFQNNHSESYDHKYKGYDYYLDIWSNIHYGYVGRSIGFTEKVLLSGSDIQQKIMSIYSKLSGSEGETEGGDSTDDITSVKLGFRLYEEFGKYAESLTAPYLLSILAEMEVNELPESKRIHVCWDPESPNCYKRKDGSK